MTSEPVRHGQSLIRKRAVKYNSDATRRRGNELIVAILEATLEELADVGYAALTMEGVASRARASKGSLYRRWSGRLELVVDAMHHRRPHALEVPDTCRIRDDILAVLKQLVSVYDSPSGEATHGLMAEIIRHPELLRAARKLFVEPAEALMLEVLRNGAARGQVRREAVTFRVAGVGPTLLRQHLLLYGGPILDSVPVGIVDEILIPLVELRS